MSATVQAIIRGLFAGLVVVTPLLLIVLGIWLLAHPVIPIESIQLPTLEMP